jgi:O-antigen/teichoic acid export membrane protein
VGLLRPASQLYENLGMFPLYASIAVYPFLSRKAQGTDRKYFSERYHELFKYFLAGSLGVSVALLAMGDEIVVSVFSKDFAASSLPLKILAWAMPCMFLNQLLGHLLASIDKQGQEALNYVIVVFAFLGMLLALIPSMSYVGVAVAMVISEALLFVWNYYSASKFTGRMPFGGIGRSILAFCVAAAALFVLSDRVYWLVPFLVAELVYLMALLICGAFSKQEIIAFAGEFHRLSVSLLKK